MSRRLKPVKDLSVLILAPRKHDRQLWADLLKNCGINTPNSMSDIEQAATVVGSGQADVVFVDESYGPQGIANVLIPARNVEFSGGRGVCLILCSKKATAQDVLNARKLGFASLVILPASTDTVRKHLELAARYIPPSDEELGWSAPKAKEEMAGKALPPAKDDPDASRLVAAPMGGSNAPIASEASNVKQLRPEQIMQTADNDAALAKGTETPMPTSDSDAPTVATPTAAKPKSSNKSSPPARLEAPGRSGETADQELVFL